MIMLVGEESRVVVLQGEERLRGECKVLEGGWGGEVCGGGWGGKVCVWGGGGVLDQTVIGPDTLTYYH